MLYFYKLLDLQVGQFVLVRTYNQIMMLVILGSGAYIKNFPDIYPANTTSLGFLGFC